MALPSAAEATFLTPPRQAASSPSNAGPTLLETTPDSERVKRCLALETEDQAPPDVREALVVMLDAVFCGGLHPPGFKCHPTANAPRHMPADEVAEYPAWLWECLESWFEEEGVEGGQRTARKVDVMEAACVVSLGGAAKTHLLDFYFQVTKNLQAPQPLYVGQDPPLRREVGNFSALAIMARKHNKIVYCPDEWVSPSCRPRGQPRRAHPRHRW